MLREVLRKAAAGETLTEGEAERALETIMEGTVPPAATAALLTALRVRGESVSEIVGFARAMRRRPVHHYTPRRRKARERPEEAPGEGAAWVRRRVDAPDHGPLARDQGAGGRDRYEPH